MKNLELNNEMVRFADLNSYEDGKRIIASLPQEAFDELVKMMGVVTTGDQWFDYLLELDAKYDDEPSVDQFTEWLDNDN